MNSGHSQARKVGLGARAPAVSVIIPFFNTPEAFFREAVASVQAQTFTDWELLLVNDGSGPEASSVADTIAGAMPDRVRCVSHESGVNRGIPASRNLGAAHARGGFIAFLDSDDCWFPHKLAEQVALLNAAPDAWMIFGRSLYWRSWAAEPRRQRDFAPQLGVRDGTILHPPEFLHRFLRRQVLVPTPSSIFVRTAAFTAINGFETRLSNLYEDQRFYAKVGLAGPVIASDAIWVRYRLHPSSVMQSSAKAALLQARREFFQWLAEYGEEQGHRDVGFRRTIEVELRALAIPGGPRVLRSLRRLAALPGRLRAMLD